VGRGWIVTGVGVLAIHGTAVSAWAQKPARMPKDESALIPWAIAGGIIVLVCVCAFLNPKRSHLT
jgi:hypothetical protein